MTRTTFPSWTVEMTGRMCALAMLPFQLWQSGLWLCLVCKEGGGRLQISVWPVARMVALVLRAVLWAVMHFVLSAPVSGPALMLSR